MGTPPAATSPKATLQEPSFPVDPSEIVIVEEAQQGVLPRVHTDPRKSQQKWLGEGVDRAARMSKEANEAETTADAEKMADAETPPPTTKGKPGSAVRSKSSLGDVLREGGFPELGHALSQHFDVSDDSDDAEK